MNSFCLNMRIWVAGANIYKYANQVSSPLIFSRELINDLENSSLRY
jgi:hypothetical protein